jgi:phage shock protein PspC (stress-responsive transcriptional regulator)
MKKALQISIAGTLFTIEEDAYAVLDTYLASIKHHFAATEGRNEIVDDIEGRIAEQLLATTEKVISIEVVEKVTAAMGRVEDFDDKEDTSSGDSSHNTSSSPSKKLYRRSDDLYIGGVASGVAAYAGINPIWSRIAFIVLGLMNGFGVLLYAILWIVLPEAKTKAQKLEMTGTPVTLETLSNTSSEKISTPSTKGTLHRIIVFPFKMIGGTLRFLGRMIAPIVRIGGGTLLTFTATVVLVSIMIFTGFLLSDSTWIFYGVPLSALLPGKLHLLVLAGTALAVIIPAVFVLLSGISLLQKRSLFTTALILGSLGVWFIALSATGFGAAKMADNYERLVTNSPSHKEVRSEIPLDTSFDKVTVSDGLRITIARGAKTSLFASGRAKDMESVRTHIENGTLVIDRMEITPERLCLFCWSESPELSLTVPTLDEIAITHGAHLTTQDFPFNKSVTLTLEHGASANVVMDVEQLEASLSHGSYLEIQGKAVTAQMQAEHGSDILGNDFQVQSATVTAEHGSRIEVNAITSLNASATHGSEIEYVGTPQVTKDTSHGSIVRSSRD